MILQPLLWFLPAYVANSTATLSRYFPRRTPVDLGVKWNGVRLLGDGKTMEGLFLGLFLGTLTGVVMGEAATGFLLSSGAMLGDLVGSFVKRRAGLKRGEEAPLIDQLDFVAGAFLLIPPSPYYAIIIVSLTPLIHRFFNILGYLLGVKREPW